ncbi:uncharacterized protein LOC116296184 [Actinia tenebrosa]|uniref:Uncharacterized protein LOC116296184 n=1 Tax=Actinia tenebrosa TaxID=6105 RepID=A0A6P8HXF8_ACTTE|nr:uncharacterized protein LOC116296184 [Actinia tenebrosa]
MKYFFVSLILCLFLVVSNGSRWLKNNGDDTSAGLGANTTGLNHQYSLIRSRRTIVQPTHHCYRQFFLQGELPTGLRPNGNPNIKYICQQFEAFNDETYYATMFDQHTGIAVYAAYVVPHDQAPLIGTFPRISKWLQDPDISHLRQGSDQMYSHNNQHIHKGHLVPAQTYSYDCIAMVSTFRYTNAVPQYAAFNSGPWSRYEDKVRKFGGVCRQYGGDLYLLTGTSEAVYTPGQPALQQPLKYFPNNNPNNGRNIAIPNSMWTAGCCIQQNGGIAGGFAAIGNNVQLNPTLNQVTVETLQNILAVGTGRGAIELFPGSDRCSADSNQYRYNDLAMHGGQWTKSKQLP